MRRWSMVVILFLYGCSRQLPKESYEKPFDEVVWKSVAGLEADKAGISPRQRMLGDLVDEHLIGKSRKDIIAMLGEPSPKMDPDGSGASLAYPTGIERKSYIRIDSEWLLISFDSSDVACGYSIGVD